MGLEVLPSANEADDFIKNAASIFEFEAKTIDDELVSLDKYRWVGVGVCIQLCIWKAIVLHQLVFHCISVPVSDIS